MFNGPSTIQPSDPYSTAIAVAHEMTRHWRRPRTLAEAVEYSLAIQRLAQNMLPEPCSCDDCERAFNE